ncbi:hypothetical protein [Haladaptatus halobius]|uniref:hypothetical protein n=1 Tax=Haladaptatus halobius TaxID=2884875 RepID=UPI001D09E752|nr:hypothetical protein [Haladaptatus halobius]
MPRGVTVALLTETLAGPRASDPGVLQHVGPALARGGAANPRVAQSSPTYAPG